jgi:hypothetical protein
MQVLTLNKPKIKDFAKERDELLLKSKSDWNLFLDSDEKLSKQILKINEKYDCYYLFRKNYFLGKYVGTDKIIRLVKKGTGKWHRAIHEVWIPNDRSNVGTIEESVIIHNTATSLSMYIEKMNSYSNIHPVENWKEGKKATLFKIIFYPIFKFVVTLVKSKNIVFSIMQSLHSFLSWSKLYLQQY